jgi:hypothetical protein
LRFRGRAIHAVRLADRSSVRRMPASTRRTRRERKSRGATRSLSNVPGFAGTIEIGGNDGNGRGRHAGIRRA